MQSSETCFSTTDSLTVRQISISINLGIYSEVVGLRSPVVVDVCSAERGFSNSMLDGTVTSSPI